MKLHDLLSMFYELSRFIMYTLYLSVLTCFYLMFHLHGFYNHQYIILLHLIPSLEIHFQNGPRHRTRYLLLYNLGLFCLRHLFIQKFNTNRISLHIKRIHLSSSIHTSQRHQFSIHSSHHLVFFSPQSTIIKVFHYLSIFSDGDTDRVLRFD